MKINWTQGLDEERKKEVTGSFKGSLTLRKRLAELIEIKVKSSNTTSISKDTYNNPNWVYLQADNVGYQRALQEILNLISE